MTQQQVSNQSLTISESSGLPTGLFRKTKSQQYPSCPALARALKPFAPNKHSNNRMVDLTEKLKADSKKESTYDQAQSEMERAHGQWNDCLHSMYGTWKTNLWGNNQPDNQIIQGNERSFAFWERDHQSLLWVSSHPTNSSATTNHGTSSPTEHWTNQFTPDPPMEYNHKQDAPATPTTMSNSPGQVFKRAMADIAPKNLLESLTTNKKPKAPNATQITSTITQLDSNMKHTANNFTTTQYSHIRHEHSSKAVVPARRDDDRIHWNNSHLKTASDSTGMGCFSYQEQMTEK
jgi:hypothetical protein